MHPPDDPSHGFSDKAQEQLIGVALVVLGIAGFGVVYLFWRFAPASMTAPPGLPAYLLPLASPLNCLLPVSAVASGALVLLGLRKLVLGE